jgi:TPR repeat protein
MLSEQGRRMVDNLIENKASKEQFEIAFMLYEELGVYKDLYEVRQYYLARIERDNVILLLRKL